METVELILHRVTPEKTHTRLTLDKPKNLNLQVKEMVSVIIKYVRKTGKQTERKKTLWILYG